jgi:tryptophan 2,3-dioxygenase
MESIMNIMRSMTVFDYQMFRTRLDAEAKLFQPNQKAMLSLRLNLLDSCLKDGTPTNRVSAHFKPGQLTIIECVLTTIMSIRAEKASAACLRRSWTHPRRVRSSILFWACSSKVARVLPPRLSVRRVPLG